ncbi:hypothetical protein AVDCRST_MAG81-4264, partial [uncultured Synechococcales cyanobacterium]
TTSRLLKVSRKRRKQWDLLLLLHPPRKLFL